MGIPFTLPMGFLFTVTMGILLAIALAIQLTISTSCILDERHALAAMRYDENNPVRRGLVDDAPACPWSGALSHVCFEPNPILAGECYLLNEIADWKAYLAEKEDDQLNHDLHEGMKTGRPCGDNGFVRMIEDLLHRKLRPAPRGRPKKDLLGNING